MIGDLGFYGDTMHCPNLLVLPYRSTGCSLLNFSASAFSSRGSPVTFGTPTAFILLKTYNALTSLAGQENSWRATYREDRAVRYIPIRPILQPHDPPRLIARTDDQRGVDLDRARRRR